MTLPALASLDAFVVRLGQPTALTNAEEERAQAAIDDASALARAEAKVDWITEDGELDEDSIPDVVVTIVLRAARRAFVNPDEVESETIDAYQVRYREVYLTQAERDLIRGTGGVVAGLGSIKLEAPWPPASAIYDADEDDPLLDPWP